MKPLTQKPIKRTALGSWLKGKAPHILDTVGDLLPDRGGLGILKVMDCLGRQTKKEPNRLLFFIYSNGEVEKVFIR